MSKSINKKTLKELVEDKPIYTKDGYIRPETTYTDQLSKEDINKKLEDYIKVEDLSTVPINTHLRYFLNVNGELKFRQGGNLHSN